jgi:uncharacterized RDD family membrane protein YckC
MATSQPASGASAYPSSGGLGRRTAAYVLDLLVALAPLLLVSFTMRALRGVGLWEPAEVGADPAESWHAMGLGAKLLIVFSFFLSTGPVYVFLFESSPWQATIGKRLLNIYVTDDNGRRISGARSCGRSLAKWGFGLFGGSLLSFVTIAATRKKKALHDFVCKTLVVSGRPTPGGSLELWRLVAAFGLPFIWILATVLVTM